METSGGTGWPRARVTALVLALALVVLALAASAQTAAALDFRNDPYRYSILDWELRNFPAKWLYEFGELFRADRSEAKQEADLRRFFELVGEIEVLERGGEGGSNGDLRAAYRERDRLENRVEDTIEARVTRLLRDEGLTTSLPLLGDVIWPPVDFEFADSPRTIAVSPRERIELDDSYLLRPDLSLEEVERLEAERAARDGVSTLAFETGGIGAYPTIVAYSDDYGTTLERVAHEWTHNYLTFRPLGIRYYESNDLRTMNETVADIVGGEIAGAVQERWPQEAEEAPPPAMRQGLAIDIRAELRQLRGEVDALLAQGKVDEAEALMESRRRELQSQGYYLRKLNQAYFAYTNLYAGEAGAPGAVNPIGPGLDELRRRSATLRDFLRLVEGFTSASDIEEALSR